MNITKLKAFTLYEMIVVMIISAIVMALAAAVFLLVSKQFNSFKDQTDRETRIRQLYSTITNETAEYNRIYINQQAKTVTFSNELKKSIIHFNNGFITYKGDTITKGIQIFGYFKDKEVKNGYVDALKVIYTSHNMKKELFFFKEYDAAFYINEYYSK